MLKEFDEFLSFCFTHGGTLRNHKQFGEMARELRTQIEAAEKPVSSAFPKYSVVPFDGSTWMVYEDGVGEVCLCSDYEETRDDGEARANMICALLNSQTSETGEKNE